MQNGTNGCSFDSALSVFLQKPGESISVLPYGVHWFTYPITMAYVTTEHRVIHRTDILDHPLSYSVSSLLHKERQLKLTSIRRERDNVRINYRYHRIVSSSKFLLYDSSPDTEIFRLLLRSTHAHETHTRPSRITAYGKLNRYTGLALKYAPHGASKSRPTSPTRNRHDGQPIPVFLDHRVGVTRRCNYCTIYNSLNLPWDPYPWTTS